MYFNYFKTFGVVDFYIYLSSDITKFFDQISGNNTVIKSPFIDMEWNTAAPLT